MNFEKVDFVLGEVLNGDEEVVGVVEDWVFVFLKGEGEVLNREGVGEFVLGVVEDWVNVKGDGEGDVVDVVCEFGVLKVGVGLVLKRDEEEEVLLNRLVFLNVDDLKFLFEDVVGEVLKLNEGVFDFLNRLFFVVGVLFVVVELNVGVEDVLKENVVGVFCEEVLNFVKFDIMNFVVVF